MCKGLLGVHHKRGWGLQQEQQTQCRPWPIRKHAHTYTQLEPLLAKSPKERQSFVTSGALHRLQRLLPTLTDPALTHAHGINSLFPEDVVAYYTHL